VQIFFATTAVKKDPGIGGAVGEARDVERLGVVGAGFMGSAIAGVAALRAGVDVRLRDTDWERVARGVAASRKILDEARTRRRLDKHEHFRRLSLVSGSPDTAGFARRDLVIEAVFEDVEVKRRTIADLEAATGDQCVIASNTSTIPIARLQDGARRPDRILGMHFFSPVERMPLLEVICGPATADWAAATAVRFGQRMGKTVIAVRDAPGFWVNRILAPYLNEAGWLLDEGATIEAVDKAMTAMGFPVGPLALLDEVGLDVAGKASGVLHEAFGERLTPPPAVHTLIADGRLGRKSGRGFYRYEGGKKKGVDPTVLTVVRPSRSASPPAATDIQRRPLLMMLNESARAMTEGIVRRPSHGDIGAVMGFGFPPYLGGPLRYIDDSGAAAIVSELERYAAAVGPRFAPCDALIQMARTGRRFYE
jgi:3-hydroxyacyl-CoA dehydrogenase/enoyl-CoA hydratase/3-hydroxybutyryl-CoA epimerase